MITLYIVASALLGWMLPELILAGRATIPITFNVAGSFIVSVLMYAQVMPL